MRCVITGVNAEGRSVVTADDEIPDPELGIELAAMDPAEARVIVGQVPEGIDSPVDLAPGSVSCRLVRLPARGEPSPPALPGVDADGFHATRTIDYIITLSGKLELLLDESSVVLAPGDLVVQRATHHAWRSASDEAASFLAVMTAPTAP